jgi:glycosyltransferase involved in cell wall biosynthesis
LLIESDVSAMATERSVARDRDEVLVSLIMPVWNPRPDWLHAAIESALAQRGCAIELIVVDNGNDTPVATLLAGVRDPRLRIIRTQHGGVSAARNAGMAEARGDFLRFLDCDDVFEPDSTRRLLALSTDDLTIAYGATAYCDAELRPYKTVVCALEGSIVTRGLTDFTVALPSLLFPRRVVDLAGAWDESMTICEDWDFVQRALEHARVRGEPAVASHYRRHSTSSVGTASIDVAERSAARVVANYVARHPDERDASHVRRATAMRLTSAGDRYLQSGERGRALSRFVEALRADPGYASREVLRILKREIRARSSFRTT